MQPLLLLEENEIWSKQTNSGPSSFHHWQSWWILSNCQQHSKQQCDKRNDNQLKRHIFDMYVFNILWFQQPTEHFRNSLSWTARMWSTDGGSNKFPNALLVFSLQTVKSSNCVFCCKEQSQLLHLHPGFSCLGKTQDISGLFFSFKRCSRFKEAVVEILSQRPLVIKRNAPDGANKHLFTAGSLLSIRRSLSSNKVAHLAAKDFRDTRV